MTLQQVALAADYDPGNLSKLERGEIEWSGPALRAICTALGAPLRDVFISYEERQLLALWERLSFAERAVIARMAETTQANTEIARPMPSATIGRGSRLPANPAGENAPVQRISLRYRPPGTIDH